jgi:hypothetical protein
MGPFQWSLVSLRNLRHKQKLLPTLKSANSLLLHTPLPFKTFDFAAQNGQGCQVRHMRCKNETAFDLLTKINSNLYTNQTVARISH